jgi:hypothetical protein
LADGDVMDCVSVALRSSLGRPRFRVGRLGVDDSDSDVGDDEDSRFSRCGDSDGETVCCGASPQRDGVCDVVSVVGEKQVVSFDCVTAGLNEKPYGYCSTCPNGCWLNGCGLLFTPEMPGTGNVGLNIVCGCGFDWLPGAIFTVVKGWSKNESESKNVFNA